MEAAISSSLSHPNIVQTYTYTIRPMRDTTQQQQVNRSSGMCSYATCHDRPWSSVPAGALCCCSSYGGSCSTSPIEVQL
jgi:hypothetical protein